MKNPFKSKKKTSVDTTVMRVVEDTNLPETLKMSMLRSILRESDLRDELLNGILEGVAPKFDRMFTYAEKHYPHGLPDVSILTSTNGEAIVKKVIEAERNRSVTIDYFYFGDLGVSHYARERLTNSYGYNPQTNELVTLSQQRGAPVYLKDITALYTPATVENADVGTLASWGPPATQGVTPSRPLNNLIGQFSGQTPYEVVPGRSQDGIRVEYEWDTPAGIRSASLTFNLTAAVLEASYFQVQYHWLANGVRHYRYWTYEQGSGKYPAIEQIHDPRYSGKGNYFPFIFFRSNKENLTAKNRENTTLYKSTSKMMEMIGMDYAGLGEEIHANPDVKDIEQAVMWLGVPITSKDQECMKYLFHYFRKMFFLNRSQQGNQSIRIQDADFALVMNFNGLRYRRYPGKVTTPGQYKHTNRVRSFEEFSRVVTGGAGMAGTIMAVKRSTRTLIWQYQESDSHYTEVEVADPKMRYDIWQGHAVNAEWNDERFLVPIDKGISDTFSITDREKLYLKGMHFIFNSRVTQKVKWYQSKWFKVVLVIAAVVITFYSAGSTWKGVVAAFAAGGIAAAAMVVLTAIVKAYAFTEGAKLFVKEIGVEAAFYIAIAAALYSGIQGFNAGSLKGAPWANEMMQLATGIGEAIQSIQAGLMKGLEADYLEMFNTQKELWAELDETKKLLGVSTLIDPFEFVERKPLFIPGETPDNFYSRTVHSGNIGVSSNDATLKFAEYALRLPTITDSLGGLYDS